MKINSDFRDLLQSLNAARVRYLIVGGYAVMVHTEPRYTKDLDIWIDADQASAERLLASGRPNAQLRLQDRLDSLLRSCPALPPRGQPAETQRDPRPHQHDRAR